MGKCIGIIVYGSQFIKIIIFESNCENEYISPLTYSDF